MNKIAENMVKNNWVSIPVEEYKELLEYKGRYLELKDMYYRDWNKSITPTITWTDDNGKLKTYPYSVTTLKNGVETEC